MGGMCTEIRIRTHNLDDNYQLVRKRRTEELLDPVEPIHIVFRQ